MTTKPQKIEGGNTLELFSGTKSFSKVAKELGYETFTVDNNESLEPDLVESVENLRIDQLPYKPDIIWASPPCTAFSVASIGHHWTGGKGAYIPKTDFEALEYHRDRLLEVFARLRP